MNAVRKLFSFVVIPGLITIVLWFAVDATVTFVSGARGFSLFYVSDTQGGHINKPNFSGRYGGFLDSFSSAINIGPLGERKSSPPSCDTVPYFIFVGDSTTAGFEVEDDETFVSRLSRDCTAARGMNFGVRATDTHEILGNYNRVSKQVKHDAVLYLISDNDLSENLRRFHYVNIAKRFGRVFNGEFLMPPTSSFERAYLGFRIFFSDRFYMTAKLIEGFERWRSVTQGNQFPSIVDGSIPAQQVAELIKLTNQLAAAARVNGAKVYVAVYPCVNEFGCEYVQLERHLIDATTKDFTVLPLAAAVAAQVERGNFKREQMRFSNDSHLSSFGHRVVAEELVRLLRNDRQKQ